MNDTEKKTYNGWTNYETWNIKLWIDNEQGTQMYWHETAQEALKNAKKDNYFTKEENAVNVLREQLKDWFEEQAEGTLDIAGVSSSWFADLLHASLSEVNWQEIANSLIEDL